MAENAVGELLTDPPAKAMHHRTHERGTLIGRKDRDRVDVQADVHLGVEAGREAGAGAQLAQFGTRIASFRLRAQKRQGDLP